MTQFRNIVHSVIVVVICIATIFSQMVAVNTQHTQNSLNAKVYILHGYGAGPNDHWFQWLRKELRQKNVPAEIIQFPDSSNPKLDEWISTLHEKIGEIDQDTFIVVHSLGCVTFLKYLQEKLENKGDIDIGGMMLVSGLLKKLPKLPELDAFVEPKINIERIKSTTDFVTVVGAKDDPIVPYHHIKDLAISLDAQLIGLDDGGHFLSSNGYDQFYRILFELEEMMNSKSFVKE